MSEALRAAIGLAGGQAALAKALGVSQPAVANWLARRVPAERVLPIEAATGVHRHRLRPDLYPDFVDDARQTNLEVASLATDENI